MQSLSWNANFLTDNFKRIKRLLTFNFLSIDQLPVLSEKRITKEQMEILWQVYKGQRDQYVD
ncbi:Phosphohydrolase (MutT/nudix family protein) [Streptococcus oralis]|nr:Phosphohydrolase (MutT/nudix family protein) [Streptococcus oralis]